MVAARCAFLIAPNIFPIQSRVQDFRNPCRNPGPALCVGDRRGCHAEEEVPDHLPQPGRVKHWRAKRDRDPSRCNAFLHADLGSSPAMSRLFASDVYHSGIIGRISAACSDSLNLSKSRFHVWQDRAGTAGASLPPIQRSGYLREDLLIMNATAGEIDSLERCHALPSITRAGLRGYTYVVLGSTLGQE